jgi:hypothetical protein
MLLELDELGDASSYQRKMVDRSSLADIEFLEFACPNSPNLHPITPWSINQKRIY